MGRKLMIILLSGVICLLGATAAIAEFAKQYELKEYEELSGKKLEFHESPTLRAKVAAGELPPVEERLPEEPLVIKPAEEIGQYGGIIRVVTPDLVRDIRALRAVISREPLLRLDPDGKTVLPNLVKDWEFSEDKKTLTLYLRKGIKWSDGEPFTADDIMFAYEDILLNDELTPAKPKVWCPGGEFVKVEKINDYTIRMHFARPHPLALRLLAFGEYPFYAPKHYLKKFHPRYTPTEKLKEMAKSEGFDYWYQLFEHHYIQPLSHDTFLPVGYPTLDAYRTKERALDHGLSERNPYYWKVDSEGNQLPYLDGVLTTVIMDKETRTAKMISGDIDFAGVNTVTPDIPLYKANAERGNYRVLLFGSCFSSETYYMPNQTHRDPVLRKIFQDIRFRKALSLAINREEINEHLFFGMGIPCQLTVHPASKYYEEKFAKAYAQYDPEEANRLLDEMGLKWDKEHKWRLRPDGKKLFMVSHFTEAEVPVREISELVREYWKAIGIDLSLKSVDWGAYSSLVDANRVDIGALFAWNLYPARFLVGDAMGLIPSRGWCAIGWCPEWSKWLVTDGKKGEEPPEVIKRNFKLWWDTVQFTLDEEERTRAIKEILRSQAENLWTIGTVGCGPYPVLVKNNLRNVPESFESGWDHWGASRCYPEQYFFKTK